MHRHHHHHHHRYGYGPRDGNPVARYVRMRLHRRIFSWFGATILVAVFSAVIITRLAGNGTSWRDQMTAASAFVGDRFEHVWDDVAARDELGNAVHQSLDVNVELKSPSGATLASYGSPCERPMFRSPVVRAGAPIGAVWVCTGRHWSGSPLPFVFALLMASGVLWAFSGSIARRLTRPLTSLAAVAKDIGEGKLSSRATVGWRDAGSEVGMLAMALNDMADRIQRQMSDQRELLAAVSHELRTPLARIRILAELARTNPGDAAKLEEIDREVVEIDRLVGNLLASSRMDFAAMTLTDLDGGEMAKRALQRAGLSDGMLSVEGPVAFKADATLVSRALANLIENAERHGHGVAALHVAGQTEPQQSVRFEVDDKGPGFPAGEEKRAFEAFYHQRNQEKDQGSLGLGLSIVKRIAEAHGGRAWAENRPEGGARVAFELPMTPKPPTAAT